MLHLSCVVHGLIYGRLMGCTVNGFSPYITLYREKNRLLYNPLNGHKSAHGPHRRDVTYVLCKVSCFFIEILSFS